MINTKRLFELIKALDPETYKRYEARGLNLRYPGEKPETTGAGEKVDAKREKLGTLHTYINWTYIEVVRVDKVLGYLKTEPHDKLPQWVFDLSADHYLNFTDKTWAAAKAKLARYDDKVNADLLALDEEILGVLVEGKPARKEPLTLEAKSKEDLPAAMDRLAGGAVMMTPAPLMSGSNDEYWLYRVQLNEHQSVVGFPKFGTIGIGFSREIEDGNTNLPFSSPTRTLFNHIKKNKHWDDIEDADVMKAIFMVQRACYPYMSAHRAEVMD